MLTKAIGSGPDHRGCSCLLIVHHHCLHGSDAPQSIAPFQQTSEEKPRKQVRVSVITGRQKGKKYKVEGGVDGIH